MKNLSDMTPAVGNVYEDVCRDRFVRVVAEPLHEDLWRIVRCHSDGTDYLQSGKKKARSGFMSARDIGNRYKLSDGGNGK